MKKKVIAAVLALLMVASSMPMNEFSSFLPTTDITASAANNRGTVKVDGKEVTWAVSTDSKTKVQSLVIKPETLFFDNTTNITVNTAKIKQALLDNADFKENYSLDNMAAIELNYNFSERRSSGTYYHSNLAHIDFSGDTFITRLGNSMFASHPYLQTIKLSGKITSIASSAFSGCTNFIGQSGNTVDLKNVEKIESSAFQGCTSLAGVNFSAGKIKSIGDNAFANCTGITSLSLPASLESIGNSSFQKNSTLKTIEFAKGSNLASIGDNAFNNCSALSNIKAEGASKQAAAATAKAPEKQNKPAKASNKKPGLGKRISNYFAAVRTEMKRVVWPSRDELRNYSVAVIVSLVVFGIALWLVDTGIVALLVGYTSLGA